MVVIPPPEFVLVGNPVFVTVTSDNPGNPTIMVDVYHNDKIIYTASAHLLWNGEKAEASINISEILQSIVVTPLPYPSQPSILSQISNWLTTYQLTIREIIDETQISIWSSDTLYAVPGSIDDELFSQLVAQKTDIFQSRLLNPAANRFLTVYAETNESIITIPTPNNPANPANPENQGCLFFLATAGEYLKIEEIETNTIHNFTFHAPALYCINLSLLNHYPSIFTFSQPSQPSPKSQPSQSSQQSQPSQPSQQSLPITIHLVPPEASWPLRTWLFLNHFGVFETFISTGRAQTSITRPENIASRYIPNLDAFHAIDLPSKPIETIKLPTGFTNARRMNIIRHFSMSDCIYLISPLSPLSCGEGPGERSGDVPGERSGDVPGERSEEAPGNTLIYYLIKSGAPITFHDDMPQPSSAELELVRSIRTAIPPVYGNTQTQAYNLVIGQQNLIIGDKNLILTP